MKLEIARETIFTMDTERSIDNALEFADMLSRRGLRAEFYFCGKIAEEHPYEFRKIAKKHLVCGHGYSHERFSKLSIGEQRGLILKTKRVFQENSAEMAGWRFPMLSFTSASLEILSKIGVYDSSLRESVLKKWKGLCFLRNWLKLAAVDNVASLPKPFPKLLIEKPVSAFDIEDKNFFLKKGRVVAHCYNFPVFRESLETFLSNESNNYNNK